MQYRDATWRVRDYDNHALKAEVDLCLDWYVKDLGYNIQGEQRDEWHALWNKTFEALNTQAPGLALRDFHAENLFWLPARQSVERVGLIDFQDALYVHPAYDLVSLLEDARRDVSPDLVEGLIHRFCRQAGIRDISAFKNAYAVLGAQRNAKILGIFVRLAERDGKPRYRDLIPRVLAHFRQNLSQPELIDLKDWFLVHAPEVLT
jgi:aminoglycoside/choline kinase family phosphotransferase